MKRPYDSSVQIVTSVIIVLILFTFLYTLSVGDVSFTASIYDKDNSLLFSQEAEEPRGVGLSQSLLSSDLSGLPTFLMSAEPIEQKETEGVFRAEVVNPFNGPATLRYVNISKNDIQISGKQIISKFLKTGETYIYKTQPIELKGLDAQINTILLKFIFEDQDLNRKVKSFQFDYYSLTQCNSDSDCSGYNNVCDKGNLARFSIDPYTYYCTKPCSTTGDCYKDQICLKGICGY